MGKFKMPAHKYFLQKKRIHDRKKPPVWVYLEKEMRDNVDKKPYNEKVGAWLKFLKDLKYYFYLEGKRKYRRLNREAGPAWYCELSTFQRSILANLKVYIHQDLLQGLPVCIRKALKDLGVTIKFPKDILMNAMNSSVEDPGVFVWNLYMAYYKTSPSQLKSNYDVNARILMSSLVFIDMEECIETLTDMVKLDKPPPPPRKKPPKKPHTPNVKYGEYLQSFVAPCYSNRQPAKPKEKPRLTYKIKLRSEQSYERLCENSAFLDKRKERNYQEKAAERVCQYKFWEPPTTLRNTDPKQAAYVEKLKMVKMKARPRHLKHTVTYQNIQFQLGGVSYTGGIPRFILNNTVSLPTGYIPINGGLVAVNGEYVINILGYWKYPTHVKESCGKTCDCLTKWEAKAMDYIKESKCKCGHLYDYYHSGRAKEKYFSPPTRHVPYWLDNARIYQLDPAEEFIKRTVRDALNSRPPTPEPSLPTISAEELEDKELVSAFLADVSYTPLLIPHLPQANLLINLQEWAKKRVKGNRTPKKHKKLMLESQRRWLDLQHIDFKQRAYRIPFTMEQLHHMDWSQRDMVQKLFHVLLEDFVTRNRIKQVELSRLFWTTMRYDIYPSKAFLDIFFTYMPGRMKDIFLVNPYSSVLTPKYGAKTCPLAL